MTSDLYDHPALYDSLLPATAHIPYYRDLARRQAGDVLELACGTGQLTVPIGGAGLPAVGLDLSAAMLKAAKERAATAKGSVTFVQGDMRQFDLGRRFAFIFVARNSLLHLCSTEDILSTFAAIRRHLAPNGIFAFDIFNPDVRILATPTGQRFPVMNVETESFGTLSVEGTHAYDCATQPWHLVRFGARKAGRLGFACSGAKHLSAGAAAPARRKWFSPGGSLWGSIPQAVRLWQPATGVPMRGCRLTACLRPSVLAVRHGISSSN